MKLTEALDEAKRLNDEPTNVSIQHFATRDGLHMVVWVYAHTSKNQPHWRIYPVTRMRMDFSTPMPAGWEQADDWRVESKHVGEL